MKVVCSAAEYLFLSVNLIISHASYQTSRTVVTYTGELRHENLRADILECVSSQTVMLLQHDVYKHSYSYQRVRVEALSYSREPPRPSQVWFKHILKHYIA